MPHAVEFLSPACSFEIPFENVHQQPTTVYDWLFIYLFIMPCSSATKIIPPVKTWRKSHISTDKEEEQRERWVEGVEGAAVEGHGRGCLD